VLLYFLLHYFHEKIFVRKCNRNINWFHLYEFYWHPWDTCMTYQKSPEIRVLEVEDLYHVILGCQQNHAVALLGGRVWGQRWGSLGTPTPLAGSRAELSAKPPEAEKHDINFALKITLVNAYRLFISHIMFVTGLSRSSHVSDFQALLYSSPTHPHYMYVFKLLIGFARISRSSPGPVGVSSCSLAPFPWWR